MRRGAVVLLGLLAATSLAAQDAENSCGLSQWHGREAEIEELLVNAEVVTVEDIGMGVTRPAKVELNEDGLLLGAAFKPIKRGRQRGFWESYEAEIAAYEMDKLLGLGMVPPTVERHVKKKTGSLQFWVQNCKLYKEVASSTPQTSAWSHQLSRMKMLDILINNADRNAQNFLVDSDAHVILIDHSRAFITSDRLLKNEKKLPNQYDRKILEKLRALDQETLEAHLKDLLMGSQIKAILERRDFLLSHVDELIADRGEARVLF